MFFLSKVLYISLLCLGRGHLPMLDITGLSSGDLYLFKHSTNLYYTNKFNSRSCNCSRNIWSTQSCRLCTCAWRSCSWRRSCCSWDTPWWDWLSSYYLDPLKIQNLLEETRHFNKIGLKCDFCPVLWRRNLMEFV